MTAMLSAVFRRPQRRGYHALDTDDSSPETPSVDTAPTNTNTSRSSSRPSIIPRVLRSVLAGNTSRRRVNMTQWADIKMSALRMVRRVIDIVTGYIFWMAFRGPGNSIPPLNNLLLLDSATSLAHKIRTRKVRSEEVVEAFIARIKDVNPVLHCVVDERYDLALEEARAADELIASGAHSEQDLERSQPFLGVPFTTKDAIKVKGLLFTAGLVKRKNVRGEADSDVVALMRKAGAIPLALTNVSELCMWWESYNKLHGRTNNPYNTNHIVGGSSGGEACIQAAAASPMGLGSDIGGSIRMPAYFNGIFGHKPTRGVVSNQGEYPIASKEHDTFLGTGPMCRYASDMLPMLRILANWKVGLLKLDEKVDISKLKIYYMEDDGGSSHLSAVHPEIRAAMKKVVSHFDKAYKIKAQKVHINKLNRAIGIWFAKMRIEGEPNFCEELANREGSINLALEFFKWCFGCSNHTFIALMTGLTERLGVQPGSTRYLHLHDMCKTMHLEFQEMLGDDGVFLYPVHPTPAPFHNEPIMKPFNFAYTAIFNVLGLPATACPLGLSTEGLPLGIQAIGALYQDHLTLAVAVELERAFGGWVPPPISSTLN